MALMRWKVRKCAQKWRTNGTKNVVKKMAAEGFKKVFGSIL